MGTNYYLLTKNKETAKKLAPYSYKLTDKPYFAYEIHLAKTSCGWLPLFQAHREGISSVDDIRNVYNLRDVELFNEYGERVFWATFEAGVLHHNGGIAGVAPRERYDKTSKYADMDMPDYLPVSHFDYGRGKYASHYFKDKEGYEFTYDDFS